MTHVTTQEQRHDAASVGAGVPDGFAEAVDRQIEAALASLDLEALRRTFVEQDQYLALERIIPPELTERLADEARRLKGQVHRSRVPGYKKSGSVGFYTLVEQGPAAIALYRSPALERFLGALTGRALQRCPEDDPHACALYYYTEPGDRVGWHYDSSFYKGERFTVLVGVVERSTSRLQCRLYTKDPEREVVELELATHPGTLVIFNGDTLHHQVTPLGGQGEQERIILTTEFVTDPRMGRITRAISNLKDSMAYFGLSALFRRRPQS